MGTLDQHVALVTGAGQGIGRGISLALAAEGAAVAVSGRTETKLLATVAEIEQRGGTAVAVTCDVTDADQISATVAQTVERLGRLDIVVNNAQEFNFGSLLDIDLDQVDAGWRSGPLATLQVMRAAHPHLAANGGCVVNISSSAVLTPDPSGIGAYAAVKSAIDCLSRAAAMEWGADGIRVNTVMPFARTPATQAAFDAHPGHEQHVLETVPVGRIGDPERDVGRVVAFLVSPAASYVTGTTLTADGGSARLR